MREHHLHLLRHPTNGRPLEIQTVSDREGDRIRNGVLREPVSGETFPIHDFVPRFVPPSNYAASFGFQWNLHDKTQHDLESRSTVSRDRWKDETRWPADLSGTCMLEAGCGSGRFTGLALETGATVVSFDYSSAVEAACRTHGAHPNLLLVQADLMAMPFAAHFQYAFCLGVLQHTPDPEQAFINLVKQLAPGGWLATDIYRKGFIQSWLHPKYWVRPFTKGQNPEKLYAQVEKYIRIMWPLTRPFAKLPRVGRSLVWRLLVADHSNLLPDASREQLIQWAILDTFDMLSPAHDHPQTLTTYRRWHEEAQLENIHIAYGHTGIHARANRALI